MQKFALLVAVLLAFPVLAVDAGPAPSQPVVVLPAPVPVADTPVAATPTTPEVEPTPEALISGVVKTAADWKAGGALAGMATLLALLFQLTKVDAVRKLLDDKGRAWIRPVLLVVLAAATGIVTALQAGASIGPAALAGAMAALSGVGMRELLVHVSPDERNRVRVDIDAVGQAADALEKMLMLGATDDMKKKLATISSLSSRARLEALSVLAGAPAKA